MSLVGRKNLVKNRLKRVIVGKHKKISDERR